MQSSVGEERPVQLPLVSKSMVLAMMNFNVQRNSIVLTLASISCLSMLLGPCGGREAWDGHIFKVDYAWDSKARLVQVTDTASGKDVNDPFVRTKIAEVADQELPRWIALSKFRVATGTFHIQFLRGQDIKILEVEHGMEGTGPNFIKDPQVTELMTRAHEGRLDLVRDLISRGENIKAVDQLGNTALMTAVSSRRVEVLRFLIEHAANINARNADGETALTFSVFSGQPEMISELISHGARLDCLVATDRATFEEAKRRGVRLPASRSGPAVNCEQSRAGGS